MHDTASWRSVQAVETDEGRVLLVRLAAGKGNVIDSAAVWELREALVILASDSRHRALVLSHAGEHFSYGASVSEHTPGRVEEFLPRFHALARDLMALDLPLLAAVRGLCLGGGLELAALCDLVFAGPTARFAQPEIALGVFAPVASLALPSRVGPGAAADLLLSGRTIDASEAQAIGLVQRIDPDPESAALAWARQHLSDKSASSLGWAVRALRAERRQRFARDLAELERMYLKGLMLTHDAREGLAAFTAKRPPRWEDR